jgi:hypothetical protein
MTKDKSAEESARALEWLQEMEARLRTLCSSVTCCSGDEPGDPVLLRR